MNSNEKEYQQFMIKLSDKAKEIHKDFEKLSLENKMRIMQDVRYLAIIELGKSLK